MRFACKSLLLYSGRFLCPPISKFSTFLPFHRSNFASNYNRPSKSFPPFPNHTTHRTFSWFTRRNSVEIEKLDEYYREGSEEMLGLNSVKVFEKEPEQALVSSIVGAQITEGSYVESTWYYYPMQTVILTLDGIRDFTGLPCSRRWRNSENCCQYKCRLHFHLLPRKGVFVNNISCFVRKEGNLVVPLICGTLHSLLSSSHAFCYG